MMTKSGPPPEPVWKKNLRQAGGKKAQDPGQPFKFEDSVPYAPRYLTDEAKKMWKKVVTVMVGAGLYTEADEMITAMFCQAFTDWQLALEKLEETGGAVLVSDKGNSYQNPWVHERNKNFDNFTKLLPHFGFSPAERTRIEDAINKGEQLSLDELLMLED